MADELAEALSHLAHVLCAVGEQKKHEFEWLKSHHGFVTKHDLNEMEFRIMASQAEMAATLRDVVVQLNKSNGEIKTVQTSVDTLNAKIAELEAVIAAGGDASQELIDAVGAVKAAAQTVDDDIPDPVVPPPTV